MKALLEVGGRSPGGTRRRWRTAGEGHPTVPGQLAGRWPSEPGGRLVEHRTERADPAVARELALKAGARVIVLEHVGEADGEQ